MASFCPTSEFRIVDLPALGRPMIATKPDLCSGGSSGKSGASTICWNASAENVWPGSISPCRYNTNVPAACSSKCTAARDHGKTKARIPRPQSIQQIHVHRHCRKLVHCCQRKAAGSVVLPSLLQGPPCVTRQDRRQMVLLQGREVMRSLVGRSLCSDCVLRSCGGDTGLSNGDATAHTVSTASGDKARRRHKCSSEHTDPSPQWLSCFATFH